MISGRRGRSECDRYSERTVSSLAGGGGWMSDQFWHARPMMGVLRRRRGGKVSRPVEVEGKVGAPAH